MKKVLSVILSVVMLTITLTACGSTNNGATDTTGGDTSGTTTETTDTADTGTDTEAPVTEEAPDISEHVTIKWYLNGSNVTDATDVLATANEYLNEKLNMTIEPIWGTWGDFDENSVLSINGGDDVDIYFTCSWSANEYNAFAKRGAYLRLDDPENDLIGKYGQDVWGILPDVLKDGATIEGSDGMGVYALPGYKDTANQYCWDVNVTLLEKYGYTIEDIQNTDYYGFEEILATVKAGEGASFYPLLVEGAVLERMVTGTIVVTGDSGTNNLLSLYLDTTNPANEGPHGNVVFNKFGTEEYKKFVEQSRKYFEAGYIDPTMGNASQANDVRTAKQLTAEYLIGTQSYALGYETQVAKERGIEVAFVPCTPPYTDTTSAQGAMMAISAASKNPERAMMFLNLLNTDPYLMTLLEYGLEGVHYDLVDGEVVFTAKRDDYMPWTNGMGNITQLPPQEGQGVDFYEEFKAYYGSASSIPVLGWAFDSKPVETEMASLSNVAAEYALALSAGTIDPAEKLPEFLEKLEANGIQKVIDEANSQLESFMAAKGQ